MKINSDTYVDLHVHSTSSDGTMTPSELVDYAIEKGLSAFALTDHDTIDGLSEAISYAQGKPIEVVPGIEFSTEYESRDIHILGLYLNTEKKEFRQALQAFQDSRTTRNHKLCEKLREIGMDITYEALLARFPDSTVTRAHYARYLLEHGYVKSLSEAFDRYLGDHTPYYIPREKVTPQQAVRLILSAGGIPILAHPTLYHMSSSRLEQLVEKLKEAGLMGIEAIYSTYTAGEQRQILQLAQKYQLLISGGSDFHGANKPKLDLGCGYGNLKIPAVILEDLKRSRLCLVFSDLDGTLLNRNSMISQKTRDAIRSMIRRGHKLILASGRPLNSVLEVLRSNELEQPGMLVISNNGALIYDCDSKKTLCEHRICQEDLRLIFREAASMHLYCQAYTDTHIVTFEPSEELEYYTGKIHLPTLFANTVDSLADALPDGSYKALVIELHDHARLEVFRKHILSLYGDRIQAVFSNDKFLELLPLQAGKGNAVRFVCDYFQVPLSHAYACGDAENDLSMLEAAGTGVAMKNADPSVKEKAALVTEEDNDHDGLVPLFDSLP